VNGVSKNATSHAEGRKRSKTPFTESALRRVDMFFGWVCASTDLTLPTQHQRKFGPQVGAVARGRSVEADGEYMLMRLLDGKQSR
jgi:hypothetical protein